MNKKGEYFFLFLMGIILFLVGLWMLQHRWINPDEGAHLSDAKLLLERKVPLVDFKSRQPFYVVSLAVFLKFFGIHYQSGRLLILLMTVGISFLMYLIAKKLYDKETAWLSQLIYIVFPFTILYSPIVKTHNVMMFWGALGILLYLTYIEKRNIIFLLLSGVSLGLAFYVRESSMAWLLAIVLAIIISNGMRWKKTVFQLSFLAIGFISVVSVVLAIYSNYMSFNEFWNSPLSPFYQFIRSFQKIAVFMGIIEPADASQNAMRIAGQNFAVSKRELRQILRMNLYLFVSFGVYLAYIIKEGFAKKTKNDYRSITVIFLPIWLFTTLVVYGYYFFARGFFPAYSLELFPPLILCFAYLINYKLAESSKKGILYGLLGAGTAYAVFFLLKLTGERPDLSFVFIAVFAISFLLMMKNEEISKSHKKGYLLFSLILLLIVLSTQSSVVTKIVSGRIMLLIIIVGFVLFLMIAIQKGLIRKNRAATRFVAIPVIIASLIAAFGESSYFLNIKYDNIWSPKIVQKVGRFFSKEAKPGDTLLSGAMVWAVDAKLEPYLDITHPSSFLSEIEPGFDSKLKGALKTQPPDFIVVERYTLRNYAFLGGFLEQLLTQKYQEANSFIEGKTSVSIFRLKKTSVMAKPVEEKL